MANTTLVMAWSQCTVKTGPTGASDAMCADASLAEIGTPENNTTTLESSEGDKLTATATGGVVVAQEQLEGTIQLKTTIIEPTDEALIALGLGKLATAGGELEVSTHIIDHDVSVEVSPKNVGAKGIRAPKCRASVAVSYSDEKGWRLDVTWNIVKSLVTGIWYKRFTKAVA